MRIAITLMWPSVEVSLTALMQEHIIAAVALVPALQRHSGLAKKQTSLGLLELCGGSLQRCHGTGYLLGSAQSCES